MNKKELRRSFVKWLLDLPAFRELAEKEEWNTIHILLEGRALCGLPGPPRVWPLADKWVPVSDPIRATCPRCLEALPRAAKH